MTKESLLSISPIDGRYKNKVKELENYFSEFALIKTRVEVEIRWLLFLLNTKSIKLLPLINKNQKKKIESIFLNFNLKEASKVKSIEKITNHDVKAVEVYIVIWKLRETIIVFTLVRISSITFFITLMHIIKYSL